MFKFLLIILAIYTNMLATNAAYLTIGAVSSVYKINGNDFDSLQDCLCLRRNTCTQNVEQSYDNFEFGYNIMQAQSSYKNIAGILVYICKLNINFLTNKISCNKRTINLSCSQETSYAILIPCPGDPTDSTTLVWETSQTAEVYPYNDLTFQTCQELILSTTVPLPTTTALTTTASTANAAPTTVSVTSVISSSTLSATSTVLKESENPGQRYSTADTTYDTSVLIVKEETPSLSWAAETPSSYYTTSYINRALVNSGQDSNSAGVHLTEQHIGIIVGTAIGAVLLTILVVASIWRFKILRKKKRESDNLSHTKPNSEELPHNAQHSQMSQIAQNPKKTHTNAESSPNNAGITDLTRVSMEHYAYIDSLPSSSPNTTISINTYLAPRETPEAHYYSLAKDCQRDATTNNSVRVHPAQQSSRETNSTPVCQSDKDKVKIQDDVQLSRLTTPTPSTQLLQGHHYLDTTAAFKTINDSTSLYSTLGSKTSVKEHPYNSLSPEKESSVTTSGHPSFSSTDSNPELVPDTAGSLTSPNSSLHYVTVVTEDSGLASRKAGAMKNSKPIEYADIAYTNTQTAQKDLGAPEIKPNGSKIDELHGPKASTNTNSMHVSDSDKNDNCVNENLEAQRNLLYFNTPVPVSDKSEFAAKPITDEITYANVC